MLETFKKKETEILFNEAKDKMRFRLFYERFRTINNLANIGQYLFPIFSIITGISFLYYTLSSFIDSTLLIILISAVLLTVLELIKNNLLSTGLQTKYSNSGKYTFILILFSIFSTISFTSSYKGAEILVKKQANILNISKENIKDKINAIGLNTEIEIKEYNKHISDLKQDISRQWKQVATKEQNKLLLMWNGEIQRLKIEKGSKATDAIKENKVTTTKSLIKTSINANIIKIIAVINELMIILSIWFSWYYYYRTNKENDISIENTNESIQKHEFAPNNYTFENILQDNPIGFKSDGNNVNKSNRCKYCGKYHNGNNKYCSENCRKKYYTKKRKYSN